MVDVDAIVVAFFYLLLPFTVIISAYLAPMYPMLLSAEFLYYYSPDIHAYLCELNCDILYISLS